MLAHYNYITTAKPVYVGVHHGRFVKVFQSKDKTIVVVHAATPNHCLVETHDTFDRPIKPADAADVVAELLIRRTAQC